MKTIGKIVTAIFVVGVLAALGWLIGAGVQGKTLKDTLPEEKQEQNVEKGDQSNENQDSTENGDEVDAGVETTSITYNAENNSICLG